MSILSYRFLTKVVYDLLQLFRIVVTDIDIDTNITIIYIYNFNTKSMFLISINKFALSIRTDRYSGLFLLL